MGVKRTDGNLMFLYAAYLAALSVGNLMDGKYVLFLGMTLPAAVLAYPVTFLVLCIISELWTSDDAYKLVILAVSVKFLGVVLLGAAHVLASFPEYGARWDLWGILGASFWDVAGSFTLGSDIRFYGGSIISFALAQSIGVWAFNIVRDRHIRWRGSPWGGRWIRYLVGSLTGEIVETLIFITLVFAPAWEKIWIDAEQQMYARGALTLLWLPFFYILTWRRRPNAWAYRR